MKSTDTDGVIESRRAEVEGFNFQFLTAGSGPCVILLHGYAQTSRMWRPIIPLLAQKFTVVAPDLPGIGDSRHSSRRLGHDDVGHPRSWTCPIARH